MTTIDGQTWEEWAAELFEYEACAECGGTEADHVPAVVLGHWFAYCVTQCPGCPEVNMVAIDGDTPGHCARHYRWTEHSLPG